MTSSDADVEPAPSLWRARDAVVLLLACVLYLLLALPRVGDAFVGDEVEFIKAAEALRLTHSHEYDRGFIDDVLETDAMQTWVFHPPLYLWSLAASFQLFGPSETSARGLGVVCGLISLALTFALTRRLFRDSKDPGFAGAAAVLLTAVNPFFVQGTLLVDIDGTVYTVLMLALVLASALLDAHAQRVRVVVLTFLFVAALSAKMTTVAVVPCALFVVHVAQRRWRAAIGDVVVGAVGAAVFLLLYAAYARAMSLHFADFFKHVGTQSPGIGVRTLAMKSMMVLAPLAAAFPLWTTTKGAVRWLPPVVVAGTAAAAWAWLARSSGGHAVVARDAATSFWLVVVPFCHPAVIALFGGVVALRAKHWLRRDFAEQDAVLVVVLAVLITYAGAISRGGTFAVYQAPIVPLMCALCAGAATALAKETLRLPIFALAAAAAAYGAFVVGDSYFLTKGAGGDVPVRDAFALVANAMRDGTAPSPHPVLGHQDVGLAVAWYLLMLLPLASAVAVSQRFGALTAPPSLVAVVVAGGLSLGLSVRQAAAPYETKSHYGEDVQATSRMAAYLRDHPVVQGLYLGQREFSFYIPNAQYIDATRVAGGYRHQTRVDFDANGALLFRVDDRPQSNDVLPEVPILFAVGHFPFLDTAPRYRVLHQEGPWKLYAYLEPKEP